MKPATLRNVAESAGVHTSTASAVLNGSQGNTRVSVATKTAVLQAAQRLGYVRNESASLLRTGSSAAVGFIGGDLRNPFFAELVAALEKTLETRNFQLMISHVSGHDDQSFENAVRLMQGQSLRSIIYWDESARPLSGQAAKHIKMLPIGFTTRPREGVWLDLAHAIRVSIGYLMSLGHRRLGFFGPALKIESPSAQARWDIVREECRQRGLPEPRQASYEGESWDVEAAKAGALRTLQHDDAAEAYLSFNDTAALGLLLARNTRRQPEVLCFDGTTLVRSWANRPPYLDLKISELARLAVEVQLEEQSASVLGKRARWLQPEVVTA